MPAPDGGYAGQKSAEDEMYSSISPSADGNIDIGHSGVIIKSSTISIGTAQIRTSIAGIHGRASGIANALPVVVDSAGH